MAPKAHSMGSQTVELEAVASGTDRRIALRMDDVGASSRLFDVHSSRFISFGRFKISCNFLFLKCLPSYRGWGPYRALTAREWEDIIKLLVSRSAVMTVAVTAAWVDWQGNLTPFPVKFPDVAKALKAGMEQGVLEIANHGLTHCIIQDKAFRPRLFSGNRDAHREFFDWLPAATHQEHLTMAQKILGDFFGVPILTLVPPGNVFAEKTLDAAEDLGIKYVSCRATPRAHGNLKVLDEHRTFAFHDREIVLNGIRWLENCLDDLRGRDICFVRDLAPASEPEANH